jgi:hypothetical protein
VIPQSVFVRIVLSIAIAIPFVTVRLSAENSGKASVAQPTPVTRQEVWQAIETDFVNRGLSEERWPRAEISICR